MPDPRDGEVVAKVDGTPILTRGDLRRWLKRRPGKPVADVVDDLINLHLFAGVATVEGFKPPSEQPATPSEPTAPSTPTDDRLQLGEAWARATFIGPEPTEAEIAAWFVERRAAARIVVKTPEAADAVLAAMKTPAPADTGDAVRRFAKLSREHTTEKSAIAPRRVLFDATGRNEVGEPAVHEAIATAAFALGKDGDISGVLKLGDSGDLAIVQRIAVRPAMKVAEVPAPELARANDGLRAARANALMKARAAELRGKVTIAVEPQTFADLRPTSMKGQLMRGGLMGRPGALGKGGMVDLKSVMKDPPGRDMRQIPKEEVLENMRKSKEQAKQGQP